MGICECLSILTLTNVTVNIFYCFCSCFCFCLFNSPWIIHYLLLTRANIDRPDLSYRIDIIHTNCLILVGSYLFNHDYLDCTFWFWQTVFYSTIFFIFVFIFNFSHIMILWVILELSISSPQYSLINRGL